MANITFYNDRYLEMSSECDFITSVQEPSYDFASYNALGEGDVRVLRTQIHLNSAVATTPFYLKADVFATLTNIDGVIIPAHQVYFVPDSNPSAYPQVVYSLPQEIWEAQHSTVRSYVSPLITLPEAGVLTYQMGIISAWLGTTEEHVDSVADITGRVSASVNNTPGLMCNTEATNHVQFIIPASQGGNL